MVTEDHWDDYPIFLLKLQEGVQRAIVAALSRSHYLARVSAIVLLGAAVAMAEPANPIEWAPGFAALALGFRPEWKMGGLIGGLIYAWVMFLAARPEHGLRAPFVCLLTGTLAAMAASALRFTYSFEGHQQYRNRALVGGYSAAALLVLLGALIVSDASNPVLDAAMNNEATALGPRAFDGTLLGLTGTCTALALLLQALAATPWIRDSWINPDRDSACRDTEYISAGAVGIFIACVPMSFVDPAMQATVLICTVGICLAIVFAAHEAAATSFAARKRIYLLSSAALLSLATISAPVVALAFGNATTALGVAWSIVALTILAIALGVVFWIELQMMRWMLKGLNAFLVVLEDPFACLVKLKASFEALRNRS